MPCSKIYSSLHIETMKPEIPQRPVFSILVIGCGLSGLASALALSQAGHHVTVFERSTVLQEVRITNLSMP